MAGKRVRLMPSTSAPAPARPSQKTAERRERLGATGQHPDATTTPSCRSVGLKSLAFGTLLWLLSFVPANESDPPCRAGPAGCRAKRRCLAEELARDRGHVPPLEARHAEFLLAGHAFTLGAGNGRCAVGAAALDLVEAHLPLL